jgi:hypothetical protein
MTKTERDQRVAAAVAVASKQEWFTCGEGKEFGSHGTRGEPGYAPCREEATVVRTNDEAAIPSGAMAEIMNSPVRTPPDDSPYWTNEGRGPVFGTWQSDVFALTDNPDVVILCHVIEVP